MQSTLNRFKTQLQAQSDRWLAAGCTLADSAVVWLGREPGRRLLVCEVHPLDAAGVSRPHSLTADDWAHLTSILAAAAPVDFDKLPPWLRSLAAHVRAVYGGVQLLPLTLTGGPLGILVLGVPDHRTPAPAQHLFDQLGPLLWECLEADLASVLSDERLRAIPDEHALCHAYVECAAHWLAPREYELADAAADRPRRVPFHHDFVEDGAPIQIRLPRAEPHDWLTVDFRMPAAMPPDIPFYRAYLELQRQFAATILRLIYEKWLERWRRLHVRPADAPDDRLAGLEKQVAEILQILQTQPLSRRPTVDPAVKDAVENERALLDYCFYRKSTGWFVRFKGKTIEYDKDPSEQGMRSIQRMLARPGIRLHVAELRRENNTYNKAVSRPDDDILEHFGGFGEFERQVRDRLKNHEWEHFRSLQREYVKSRQQCTAVRTAPEKFSHSEKTSRWQSLYEIIIGMMQYVPEAARIRFGFEAKECKTELERLNPLLDDTFFKNLRKMAKPDAELIRQAKSDYDSTRDRIDEAIRFFNTVAPALHRYLQTTIIYGTRADRRYKPFTYAPERYTADDVPNPIDWQLD